MTQGQTDAEYEQTVSAELKTLAKWVEGQNADDYLQHANLPRVGST